MQRVILDTNVIVSALIQRSYPYLILNEVLEGKIGMCVSVELLNEYAEVLQRPKFQRFQDFMLRAEAVLTEIQIQSLKFVPKLKLNVLPDVDDNFLLDLADESGADFLVTGNYRDFRLNFYKRTRIVSPAEYWDAYLQ